MAMKNINITILSMLLLFLLSAGCDKDPYFEEGDYFYTSSDDLKYLENYDGILVNWNYDEVTDDQQVVIREIVANMVRVDGGSFNMGASDSYSCSDEMPVHSVTLSNFRINKFTVTRGQWQVLMGSDLGWNDNYGTGDELPVTNLTYDDCNDFVEKLNSLTGLFFRLPTEAEWEYAARGGAQSGGYRYSGSNNPDEVAWHQGNAGNVLHRQGILQPNELGLYDMSGNIWEWCSDWYSEYIADAQTDPQGPFVGNRRVVRGGSFSYEDSYSRTTQRNSLSPDYRSFVVGFRLAMDNDN